MKHTSMETKIDVPISDDEYLSATYYNADMSTHRAILICPAMGVSVKFYMSFGKYLCSQGFHVLLIDYQGIGESKKESIRHCSATMQSWAERDIASSLRWIINALPTSRIAIIGHSAGGQLACLSNSCVQLDAVVMVASQSGYWRHWGGCRPVAMLLLWYALIPGLCQLFGYFPSRKLKQGEDLPKGVALQWARWGRSKMYIASDMCLADRYSKFTGPILAFGFTDDTFAPDKAVKALLACFTKAAIEQRTISPGMISRNKIGHFGYFQSHIGEETLWKDTTRWLKTTLT